MKKKGTAVGVTVLIAAVVILSVVAFLLFEKTGFFWTAYIFTLLAAMFILGVILNLRGGKLKELPCGYLVIQYAIIEVVLVAIFSILGWGIPGLSVVYFIVAEVLLLAIYVLLLATAFNAGRKAETIEEKEPKQKDWNSIVDDIESVVDRIGDLPQGISSGTMQRLFRLLETARGSDVAPEGNLQELEDQIRSTVAALCAEMDEMITSNKEDCTNFDTAMGEIERLIEERNQKLKGV